MPARLKKYRNEPLLPLLLNIEHACYLFFFYLIVWLCTKSIKLDVDASELLKHEALNRHEIVNILAIVI